MIKTVEDALKVLNERNFKEKEWRFGEDPCYVVSVNKFGLITVYEHDDAIAFGRQLNGDYEALERQVQTLKEAAKAVIQTQVWLPDSRFRADVYRIIARVRSALSSIEEKTDSGDTLSANQS